LARFFKFKAAADRARAADRHGLDLPLTDDLAILATPVDVGGRRVGNRLAIQPMEGCDGTPEGAPGDLTYRRYDRFGAGGAKLIWGEAAAVVPEGRANPRQLVAAEAHASGLARIVETCRCAHRNPFGDDSDLLIGLQLTHSGRYSVPRPLLIQDDPALPPRAPGTLLQDVDLDRLQDAYAASARLAYRVGFDFVDLKQCHRYLLNELLAARNRPGKYGGPFENRTRFIREVVARIRSENPGALIATRLNVFDGIPYRRGPDSRGVPVEVARPYRLAWGTSLDNPDEPNLQEPIALVGTLKEAGVGLVNVTLGNPYASPHLLRPFEYAPVDGYETPEHPLIGVVRHFRLTSALQKAHPDLPMVGSGYSWLQAWIFHAGAANVRDGRVTFVGVGRGALAHPDFGKNVLEGRPLDPKRTCRTFSYCTALMRSKHNALGQFATGCPPFDKEVYGPVWREAKETGS
jgi:NADPH2 dehydrogenase